MRDHKGWIITNDGPFFVLRRDGVEKRFRTRGAMADFLAGDFSG